MRPPAGVASPAQAPGRITCGLRRASSPGERPRVVVESRGSRMEMHPPCSSFFEARPSGMDAKQPRFHPRHGLPGHL